MMKLILDEEDSLEVRAHWRSIEVGGAPLFAPSLLLYELTSNLRNKAHRGLLTDDEAASGLTFLMSLSVRTVPDLRLHPRALQLATAFNRPNAYDAHYLALAEELDCELWTADGRLYNAVHERFPLIRMLGA